MDELHIGYAGRRKAQQSQTLRLLTTLLPICALTHKQPIKNSNPYANQYLQFRLA
jgi:hypothetical protein